MDYNNSQSEWWRTFYDAAFTDLLLIWKDAQELAQTIKFLTEKLSINAGMRIFDQCCGTGSLSLPLAARGAEIIGVDLSRNFIEQAHQQAMKQHLSCQYFYADAFNFITETKCDAAINWHTSFGYAETDADNLAMLKCAANSLRVGGKFALDFPNMAGLLHNFKETFTRRFQFAEGEAILIRESQINLVKGRLEQQWLTIWPDHRRDLRSSSVRLYLPHALSDLLRNAGFNNIEFYGGINGEPLQLNSPRCILIATREEKQNHEGHEGHEVEEL